MSRASTLWVRVLLRSGAVPSFTRACRRTAASVKTAPIAAGSRSAPQASPILTTSTRSLPGRSVRCARARLHRHCAGAGETRTSESRPLTDWQAAGLVELLRLLLVICGPTLQSDQECQRGTPREVTGLPIERLHKGPLAPAAAMKLSISAEAGPVISAQSGPAPAVEEASSPESTEGTRASRVVPLRATQRSAWGGAVGPRGDPRGLVSARSGAVFEAPALVAGHGRGVRFLHRETFAGVGWDPSGSRRRGSSRNRGDSRFSNGNRRRRKGGGVSHLHHAGFSLPCSARVPAACSRVPARAS